MCDPNLPPALTRALDHGKLAVFCGAGLSALAPSSLPTWWELNTELLEEARRLTLDAFPGLPEAVAAPIRALSLTSVPVESLSDLLAHGFAGESWFEVLKILDGELTNANHQALVELARKRRLGTVITTNFDTLIERAFRQTGFGLGVLASDADFQRPPAFRPTTVLYKLHGSVTDVSTLIDTVTQKLGALPVSMRNALIATYRDQHVLVVGSSGADLSFGDDYLAFSGISPDTPGITWLVPPKYRDSVSPRVQEAVSRAGQNGSIVYDTLPGFWQRLGLDISVGSGDAPGEPDPNPTRTRMREFFQLPHIGPLNASCFVLTLLWRTGERAAATGLTRALAAHPSLHGPEYPLSSVTVMARLGVEMAHVGDIDGAIGWSEQAIRGSNALAHLAGPHKSRVRKELFRNVGMCLNNIAVMAIKSDDFARASTSLEAATGLLEAVDAGDLLSLILLNRAILAAEERRPAEEILVGFRRALRQAGSSGNAQVLGEAGLGEAEQLMKMGEYWSAVDALQRAEAYIRLKGSAAFRGKAIMIRAELELRRGHLDRAGQILDDAIKENGIDRDADLTNLLLVFRVALLGFAPAMKAKTEQILEHLVQVSGIDASMLEELRSSVGSGRPELNVYLEGLAEDQGRLRSILVEAGYRGEWVPETKALEQLVYLYPDAPQRMLDLSRAYHAAALNAGDMSDAAHALYLVGAALRASGHPEHAEENFTAALRIREISVPTQLAIHLHRYRALSLDGEPEAAEKHLRRAINVCLGAGDGPAIERAAADLVEHFLRHHDPANACTVLRDMAGDERMDPEQRVRFQRWSNTLLQGRQAEDERGSRDGARAPDTRDLELADLLDPEALEARAREAHEAERPAVARTAALQAQGLYQTRGEPAGSLRCARLLADIAAAEGEWSEALLHAQALQADALKIGDTSLQIEAWSRIAVYRLHSGDLVQAESAATACDLLASERPIDESLAYAWHVLAQIRIRRHNDPEARAAAQRFVEIARALQRPALDPFRVRYEQLLRTPTPVRGPELASVARPESLEEAARLNRAGLYPEALALLETLQRSATEPRALAQVLGTRGNVLQNFGSHEEACGAYSQAAELFRRCGEQGSAVTADTQRASSLRRLGRLDEADDVLRAALSRVSAGPLRHHVILTLMNARSERLQMADSAAAAPLMEELQALMEEAERMPGVDEESTGLYYLNTSSIYLYSGDVSSAVIRRSRALQHLLRCNSRHVDVARKALTDVLALARDTKAGQFPDLPAQADGQDIPDEE